MIANSSSAHITAIRDIVTHLICRHRVINVAVAALKIGHWPSALPVLVSARRVRNRGVWAVGAIVLVGDVRASDPPDGECTRSERRSCDFNLVHTVASVTREEDRTLKIQPRAIQVGAGPGKRARRPRAHILIHVCDTRVRTRRPGKVARGEAATKPVRMELNVGDVRGPSGLGFELRFRFGTGDDAPSKLD